MKPWPLPPTDRQCLNEAMLLSCAMIGATSEYVEGRILISEAAERDGLRDVSFHLLVREKGQLRWEQWIEVRADGSGRTHWTAPEQAANWPVREIDFAQRPARERLLRLAERASALAETDAATIDAKKFIGNALKVTASGVAPEILHIAREAILVAINPPPGDGPEKLLSNLSRLSRKLPDLVHAWREFGKADGKAAAQLLLGNRLSQAVAASVPGEHTEAVWVQYLTLVAGQFGGMSPNLGPVFAKAVREGFASVIEAVGEEFFIEGERHRMRAINLPDPNRIAFAKILYDGFPRFFAALQSFRALGDLLPEGEKREHWLRRFRAADEMIARFVDGMIEQWDDMGEGRLHSERDQIAEARRRGDKIAEWSILNEGEQALRRPRSARAFLTGQEFTK